MTAERQDRWRLAWVSPYDPEQQRGGWQGMSYGLLSALRRQRPSLDVVAPVPCGRDPAAKWRSRLLTLATGRRLVWNCSNRCLAGTSDAFHAMASGVRPDAFLFFGGADFLGTFPDRPFSCYVDSAFVPFLEFYAAERRYASRELKRLEALEREWLSRCAYVFASSRFAGDIITSRYSIPPDRVVCVKAGPVFGGVVERPATSDRQRSVLFIGADFYRKGGDMAVEAVGIARRVIPELTLDVLGETPPDRYRREYVRIHGWVDRVAADGAAKFDRLMRSSSLFLSLSRADLTPTAICEACVYGLPTLSCAVGGIPEMIADGKSGWLVPANATPELVAHRLVEALSDPARLAACGLAAREQYDLEWNWDAAAGKILSRLDSDAGLRTG